MLRAQVTRGEWGDDEYANGPIPLLSSFAKVRPSSAALVIQKLYRASLDRRAATARRRAREGAREAGGGPCPRASVKPLERALDEADVVFLDKLQSASRAVAGVPPEPPDACWLKQLPMLDPPQGVGLLRITADGEWDDPGLRRESDGGRSPHGSLLRLRTTALAVSSPPTFPSSRAPSAHTPFNEAPPVTLPELGDDVIRLVWGYVLRANDARKKQIAFASVHAELQKRAVDVIVRRHVPMLRRLYEQVVITRAPPAAIFEHGPGEGVDAIFAPGLLPLPPMSEWEPHYAPLLQEKAFKCWLLRYQYGLPLPQLTRREKRGEIPQLWYPPRACPNEPWAGDMGLPSLLYPKGHERRRLVMHWLQQMWRFRSFIPFCDCELSEIPFAYFDVHEYVTFQDLNWYLWGGLPGWNRDDTGPGFYECRM